MSSVTPIIEQGIVSRSMSVIYECPSNSTARITSIRVLNESEGYEIEVRKSLSDTNEIVIFKFTLDQGDDHIHDVKINLESGQKIVAASSVNTTNYIIEGEQTFST